MSEMYMWNFLGYGVPLLAFVGGLLGSGLCNISLGFLLSTHIIVSDVVSGSSMSLGLVVSH